MFCFFVIVKANLVLFGLDLMPMGKDLVSGVISTIDGEKDPRNLLLAFYILYSVLKSNVDGIVEFAEELFEVSACYFPITFQSSESDGVNISNRTLSDKLKLCLCAHPSLCEHTVPLLLSKLMSSSKVAQIAATDALEHALISFEAPRMTSYLPEILESFQSNLTSVTSSSSEVVDETLRVLVTYCRHLLPTSTFSQTLLSAAVSSIASSPSERLGRVHARILHAMAHSRSHTLPVLNATIPVLENSLASLSKSPSDKIALLELMSNLCSLPYLPDESLMILFKLAETQLSGGFSEQRSLSLRCISLCSKHQLFAIESQQEELNVLVQTLIELLQDSAVRPSALATLQELCSRIPDAIATALLSGSGQRDLEALSLIASSNVIAFELILPYMISQKQTDAICKAVRSLHDSSDVAMLAHQAIARLALDLLHEEDVVESNLESILELIRAAVWPADVAMQSLFINGIVSAYLSADLSAWAALAGRHLGSLQIAPRNDIVFVLLCVTVCGLRIGVEIPSEGQIVDSLISIALSSHTSSLAACKALASIENKSTGSQRIDLSSPKFSRFVPSAGTPEAYENFAKLTLWLNRATLQHGSGYPVSENLLALISSHDAQAPYLAQNISILLRPYRDVLNQAAHARSAVMFRQRWFESLLPSLLKLSDSAGVLTRLVLHVPKAVVAEHLDELLPILLRDLDSDEPDLTHAALLTLSKVIEDEPLCISNVVSTVVPLLLRHASNSKQAVCFHIVSRDVFSQRLSVYVCVVFLQSSRAASVQCLCSISVIPFKELYPLRHLVLDGLEPVLDDRKRVVRQLASRCRNIWY